MPQSRPRRSAGPADCKSSRLVAGRLLVAALLLLAFGIHLSLGDGPVVTARSQADTIPDTYRYAIGGTDAVDRYAQARAVAGSYVDSSVYAVDAGNHRLFHFKLNGDLLWMRGDFGSAAGQLNEPVALALDEEDHVYVLERGNRRISVFDGKTGNYLSSWDAPTDAARAWRDPVDLASSTGGAVYLLDKGRGQVLRYASTGEILGTIGSPGSGDGQMLAPTGIAVAPDKSVWVADSGNSRLLRFSARGLLLGTHFGPGRSAGQFEGLQDVVVAGSGAILTAESNPTGEWTRIQHFDETLRPFTSWGDREFKHLVSIGITAGNSVFVADEGDNSFQRFSLTGEFDNRLGGDHETVGEIGGASGIDLTRDGRLLVVADRVYHRIRRFDLSGILKDSFGMGGSEDAGQLNAPGDVAVAPDGTVYVADTGNHRVQRFGANGSAPAAYDLAGSGRTVGPVTRLAIDLPLGGGEPLLFAADPANHRILRLSRTGQFLGAWGQEAPATGEAPVGSFGGLSGLAFRGGRVTAGDDALGRVQVFDPQGGFLGGWGSPGQTAGQLDGLLGLSVDDLGRTWVAEAGAGRVQVLDAAGRPLGQIDGASGIRFQPADVVVGLDGKALVMTRSRRVLVFGRGPSAGWRLEFYAGTDLAGGLLNVAQVETLNLNWATGRPAPGVPEDGFSVRAIGFTQLQQAGELRGFIKAQGGARVWIGGRLALDRWDATGIDEDLLLTLPAGVHRVEVAYRDVGGAAGLSVLDLPLVSALPEPTAPPNPTPGWQTVGRLALPWLGAGR